MAKLQSRVTHSPTVTAFDNQAMPPHPCPGPRSRRSILRFGVGSVGLAGLLQGREAAAVAAPAAPRSDTAIILVYCHGGASQLETWDPKPDAPPEFRGPYKAIETSVSGLRYSEVLPK